MSAYLYNMPVGFAGNISRVVPAGIVESKVAGSALAFGDPVALSDGAVVLAGGTNLTDVYGFVVRPFPTQQGVDGTIASGEMVSVLKAGYMTVTLTGVGDAAVGGKVYVTDKGAITADDKVDQVEYADTGAIFSTSGEPGAIVEIAFNV